MLIPSQVSNYHLADTLRFSIRTVATVYNFSSFLRREKHQRKESAISFFHDSQQFSSSPHSLNFSERKIKFSLSGSSHFLCFDFRTHELHIEI